MELYRTGLTLVLTSTLLGCQTESIKQVQHSNVELGPHASRYIQITNERAGFSTSNLLRAGANGINTSSLQQQLRFRFIWLDSAGFEISGLPSRWQYTTLPPNESFSLEMIASSPSATDYRIRIYDHNGTKNNDSQGIEQ